MKHFAASVFLAAALAATTTCGAAFGAGSAEITRPAPEEELTLTQLGRNIERYMVQVGGIERTYYVYVPGSARQGGAPLVIAFHGGGQDAKRFAKGVGLQAMADRHGFIIAAPEGVADPQTGVQSWNTGSTTPQGYAEIRGIDDLAFVRRIIDDSLASGRVDPRRIYALGVSRGGMMAYWAACNFGSQDFAAIAVVAATLASGNCARPQGVSLLHIHGTDDQRVPFEGGSGRFTARGGTWESARQGIQIFASGAQCASNWTAVQAASDTTCYSTSCPGADEVEYCLVEGGGHAWPGVPTTRRQERQGVYSSPVFFATEEIAEFFEAH